MRSGLTLEFLPLAFSFMAVWIFSIISASPLTCSSRAGRISPTVRSVRTPPENNLEEFTEDVPTDKSPGLSIGISILQSRCDKLVLAFLLSELRKFSLHLSLEFLFRHSWNMIVYLLSTEVLEVLDDFFFRGSFRGHFVF